MSASITEEEILVVINKYVVSGMPEPANKTYRELAIEVLEAKRDVAIKDADARRINEANGNREDSCKGGACSA